MSQAGSTGHGGGAGAIFTITGNDGVPESAVGGNFNIVTANSTAKFLGSAGTETLDFSLSNLLLGSSGSAITSASSNIGYGQAALTSITSGSRNVAIGIASCGLMNIGGTNIAIGTNTLSISQGSSNNIAIGDGTLQGLTTSSGLNTAIGGNALGTIATGTRNIGLGNASGSNYTSSESSNIIIGNVGVLGESNVIRIGTAGSGAGQQNKSFLAGVTGVTVSASAPVAVDTNGQLSSLGFGTATNVFTSNGAGVSPSWQAPATPVAKAFMAYASANLTNVTGAGVLYTVLFDSTTRNDGTAYAAGTGLFTAPVTGFYSFSCTLDLVSGTAFSAGSRLIVSTNGSVMSQVLGEFNPNPIATFTNALLILSYSWMQKMTAGDTVGITIVSTSTLQDISVVGNAISSSVNTQMSTFSGFLAGT